MRVRLIVNPRATGVSGSVLDAVVAQLERVCDLEVAQTERAGHAIDLAREVDAGAVVAVGGDGTANEVANGVRPGVLMGVLPAGASSVLARHLGFPREA
jgi:diacylglycerol kinase family enzyme